MFTKNCLVSIATSSNKVRSANSYLRLEIVELFTWLCQPYLLGIYVVHKVHCYNLLLSVLFPLLKQKLVSEMSYSKFWSVFLSFYPPSPSFFLFILCFLFAECWNSCKIIPVRFRFYGECFWKAWMYGIRSYLPLEATFYSTLFPPHLFHHKVLLDRESWFNVFLRRSFPSAILFSSLAPWFPGKFNYIYIYIYI